MDLALHLPLRYDDETALCPLAHATPERPAHFVAQVIDAQVQIRGRRQLLVTVAELQASDLQPTGAQCLLRFFNFYPSQQQALAPGQRVRLRGEVQGSLMGWQMLQPQVKPASAPLPEGLTPVYPTTAGLSQPVLRRRIAQALARVDLSETLPLPSWDEAATPDPEMQHALAVCRSYSLPRALSFLHQPPPGEPLAEVEERRHPAWLRLKLEELWAQQLAQAQARAHRATLRAPQLGAPTSVQPGPVELGLYAVLPFALTGAQQRVVAEIAADIGRAQPMHRLLQGDVGAGKTVVAALAAARCIDHGHQCVLMAPTELLAAQHFGKLAAWLQPLLARQGRSVAWLAGTLTPKLKRQMHEQLANGTAALVVGTHAVLQAKVQFARLGLAVIDEQHRFGVAQRLALRETVRRQGNPDITDPHVLMMSATPIPRTLAMSYYADLDVSTIDELPPGRTPIVTKLIRTERRDEVIARLRALGHNGQQAYWVCPLVEESEAIDLANATDTHAELAATLAPLQVALLHARMPTADKQATMQAFAAGHIQVLVATTVIEVGVDVPNASSMVIEHAERFGLSQLHQLRGRVGRGAAASSCVLLYDAGEAGRLGEAARERLKAMVETTDGFEIARRDLAIRGPGEFLGARQSGAALLRFADLQTDAALLEWAREHALTQWRTQPQAAQRHVQRWLGDKLGFYDA